jgi:hypothetical protein
MLQNFIAVFIQISKKNTWVFVSPIFSTKAYIAFLNITLSISIILKYLFLVIVTTFIDLKWFHKSFRFKVFYFVSLFGFASGGLWYLINFLLYNYILYYTSFLVFGSTIKFFKCSNSYGSADFLLFVFVFVLGIAISNILDQSFVGCY